ncbi:hypothetical protein [Demequina sp.]|uniref:hypothetical protein n=1 Tax=Demequina sp. TaxID=2050685 RepID=UPI0025BE658A|nr:hypothetical protein [Demequina sp.]
MATRPAMRVTVAAMTAALAVASLSGCGSNPVEDAVQNQVDNVVEDQVGDAAEQAIEDAIKEDTGDDVDLDFGGGASVPDSFPAGFPLPDGTLVVAIAMDQGWQLSYEIDDVSEAEDVAAHFASDSGYEETVNANLGGIQTWTYTGEEYSVTIGLVPDDQGSQMSYLVVRTDS